MLYRLCCVFRDFVRETNTWNRRMCGLWVCVHTVFHGGFRAQNGSLILVTVDTDKTELAATVFVDLVSSELKLEHLNQ